MRVEDAEGAGDKGDEGGEGVDESCMWVVMVEVEDAAYAILRAAVRKGRSNQGVLRRASCVLCTLSCVLYPVSFVLGSGFGARGGRDGRVLAWEERRVCCRGWDLRGCVRKRKKLGWEEAAAKGDWRPVCAWQLAGTWKRPSNESRPMNALQDNPNGCNIIMATKPGRHPYNNPHSHTTLTPLSRFPFPHSNAQKQAAKASKGSPRAASTPSSAVHGPQLAAIQTPSPRRASHSRATPADAQNRHHPVVFPQEPLPRLRDLSQDTALADHAGETEARGGGARE